MSTTWVHGVPYGFAVGSEGSLAAVEAEQAVIAEIVERRDRGMPLRSLAWLLNSRGVPAKKGGSRWYASTVRSIYRTEMKRRREGDMGQLSLDLEAGERARDRVLGAAGDEDWIAQASALVVEHLAGQEVLAERFRVVCESHGVGPRHHNGWGALTMALAKAGTITDTGRLEKSTAVRSHARRQPVWRVEG